MAIANCICCQGETGDACDNGNPPTCRGIPIAEFLLATVTTKTGTCSCYPDQFLLQYNAFTNRWISTVTVCDDTDPIFISVFCDGGSWFLDAGGFETSLSITATCDPLQFTFCYSHNDTVCIGNVCITVIENP